MLPSLNAMADNGKCHKITLVNPASMYQGPVPDSTWHMTSKSPDHQHHGKDMRPVLRVEVNKPEQTHMSHYHHSPHLVEPVPALKDPQQGQGTAGSNGQLMPGNEPGKWNCKYRTSKQDACDPDMAGAQQDFNRPNPTWPPLLFVIDSVLDVHIMIPCSSSLFQIAKLLCDYVQDRPGIDSSTYPSLYLQG